MNTSDKTFLTIITLLSIVALCVTAYLFLVRHDYDIVVEAPCDTADAVCFYRDCSAGDCPSNEFEQYRIFTVRAEDFSKCTDNSCLTECQGGTIACTEVICGESEGDECAQ